jgi:hypothetical protein
MTGRKNTRGKEEQMGKNSKILNDEQDNEA